MLAKKIIKMITPPILSYFHSRLSNMLKPRNEERIYKINNYEIILPPEHCLDIYQRKFKKYDKFLPELSKYITDGVIIDIGANVGDTLYGVLQSASTTKYICIEPEPYFFSYLKRNVQRLPESEQKRVTLFNSAISAEHKVLSFSSKNGTAHQDKNGKHNIFTKTIDDIIEEFNSPIEDYKLIKIDTDGYDYDCILSGQKFFLKTSAAVFWENEISDTDALNKYTKAIRFLLCCGYTKFYIFDNYGNFITTTIGEDILYLLKYQLEASVNIYYFDILACKDKTVKFIDNIIKHVTR